jgi:anti-sigma factor RsiW
MGNLRCKWVRDRLPLVVGDELRGLDRRRVERHLIGCPPCRQHQASLGQALETLRTVAATVTVPPGAPSLWPALARQIRESRRPVPAPTFSFSFASFLAWPRANPWPALGLGVGLLAALGVGFEARQQTASGRAQLAANHGLIAPVRPSAQPRSVELPDSRSEPRRDPSIQVEPPVVDFNPAPRLDFQLERGRPMSSEARDTRDTKFTY